MKEKIKIGALAYIFRNISKSPKIILINKIM